MSVTIATTETFDELTQEGVVLIDFYAPWCNPCKMLSPILDQVGEQAEVIKVDIDEEPKLQEKYNVMGVPTLLVFKDGELKERLTGFQSKDNLLSLIDSHR